MKPKLIALVLALLLVLTGCGGGKSAAAGASVAYSKASEAPMPVPEAMMMDTAAYSGGESGNTPTNYDPDVKMIYRASLEAETTDFDGAHAALEGLTARLEGYFEEQSVRSYSSGYRNGSYVVRVPANRFREFLSQMGELCNLVYQTQSAENITEVYYDTDARLQTAKIKLGRLQELLAKAENMADIITLESAISDTEYQIESLSGRLRHYDALVGYATVNVELREVRNLTEVETTPPSFGQELVSALKEGVDNFREMVADLVLFVAANLPGLAVLAVIVVVLVRLFRRKGLPLPGRKKKTPPSDQPKNQ